MGCRLYESNDVVPPEYPVTPNAFQKHLGFTLWSTAHCYGGFEVAFCSDAFLTGLSADGSALLYSTYLGGDGPDLVHAMALDPRTGRVYLTGQACGFFPVTEDATQSVSANCKGAFLAIIDPIDTGALVFSTHLAGSAFDLGTGVARAPSGDVWVAGYTSSTDFPLVDPLTKLAGGNGYSVFATRFSFGPVSSPSPLRISRAAGKVTLTWSGGTLQEADNPVGLFQTVPSATSPYSIPATGPAKFYRVQ